MDCLAGLTFDSFKGKAVTTVTVKIPRVKRRLPFVPVTALAGAFTDGRVSDGVNAAGTPRQSECISLSFPFVVMQGENKFEVVSNAKGNGDDFETNNTAFGKEEGIVTYTIDTSGIFCKVILPV